MHFPCPDCNAEVPETAFACPSCKKSFLVGDDGSAEEGAPAGAPVGIGGPFRGSAIDRRPQVSTVRGPVESYEASTTTLFLVSAALLAVSPLAFSGFSLASIAERRAARYGRVPTTSVRVIKIVAMVSMVFWGIVILVLVRN